MITARLAKAMDDSMHALEIDAELQDAWANPDNRDALIRVLRQLRTRAGELIDPNAPKPAERGVMEPLNLVKSNRPRLNRRYDS